MNIAFLFNSDHPSLSTSYGSSVMKNILSTGILQSEDRNMRISIGDILTYPAATQSSTPTFRYLNELCINVYTPDSYDNLISEKLYETFTTATVFCWLFQNMTSKCANALHNKLIKSDTSYLGAMDVTFSEPLHLRFFRNSLIESYRIHKNKCSVFYVMSENEDPDYSVKEAFEKHGYDVTFEDIGGRRTILDNYDTIEHFQRVEDFREHFSSIKGVDRYLTDNIILSLEELHPKLFDSFAAAARTLKRAETEEDLAQASLSGRRILEKIADYLYPPSTLKYKNRKIGKAEYKNRIWAYIETTIEENKAEKSKVIQLGKEADRLVELFNSGLHSSPNKEKVEESFKSLLVWISDLIELSPLNARKPYLAYTDEFFNFLDSVFDMSMDEN